VERGRTAGLDPALGQRSAHVVSFEELDLLRVLPSGHRAPGVRHTLRCRAETHGHADGCAGSHQERKRLRGPVPCLTRRLRSPRLLLRALSCRLRGGGAALPDRGERSVEPRLRPAPSNRCRV